MKIKKIALLLTISTLLYACNSAPNINAKQLNGYWEIEKVIFHNGEEKIYNYNETIDFISINDSLQGVRKKLKPQFNNTYKATNQAEKFQLKFENDSVNLYYSTAFSTWKETLIALTEKQLIIANTKNIRYVYKPYEAIIIKE